MQFNELYRPVGGNQCGPWGGPGACGHHVGDPCYRCSHSGPLHFAQNVACLHEFQDFVPRGYYGCNNKDVRSSATSEKQGLTPWWPSQFQMEFVDEGETFVEGC